MRKPKLHIVNTSFFVTSAVAALVLGPIYVWKMGLSWSPIFLFLLMFTFTMMSISGGYHRLYSHRTHEAAPWLKLFYLLFGAAAFEQACVKWATEHRAHHRFVDTDQDPYNIKRGAFWAHIGWILHEDRLNMEVPKDLSSDPFIVWQDKYWIWIAIIMGFGFPTALGALWGDPWGGFVFGGVVRMFVAHHCTFMINSLAHMIGTQPYSDENTARDSWITSIFTMGEGYHNFHHWSPGDYRNGARSFHWDPPKWFIYVLSWFGQTWDLKRVNEEVMEKAMADMTLKTSIEKHANLQPTIRQRLEEQYAAFVTATEEMSARRKAWMAAARASTSAKVSHEVEQLRLKFEESRTKYREAQKAWRTYIRQLKAATA